MGHFRIVIVSTRFSSRSRLQRHQMIYEALSEMLRTDIHALSIEAWAPGEHGSGLPGGWPAR